MIVEYRMHDAFLTAIRNVVIPRVEMAVRTITGSTEHGMKIEVHKPDRKLFPREYYKHTAHVGLKPVVFRQ